MFLKDLIGRKRFRESKNLTSQNFLKMTFPRISEIVPPPMLLCSSDTKLQNELNTFSRTRKLQLPKILWKWGDSYKLAEFATSYVIMFSWYIILKWTKSIFKIPKISTSQNSSKLTYWKWIAEIVSLSMLSRSCNTELENWSKISLLLNFLRKWRFLQNF